MKISVKKLPLKRIIAAVAVCFLAVVFVNQFSRLNDYNKQIEELNGQIAAEQERAKELAQKKDVYSSKESVEQIARETLGLVRANEKVYIDSKEKN